MGLLYTQIRAPLTTDFEETRVGTKRGISSAYWVWEPFVGAGIGWGEANVQEAVRAGGIREVSHLDYEMTVVLFVFQRFRVIAYGDRCPGCRPRVLRDR
jgi:hypothetical protein